MPAEISAAAASPCQDLGRSAPTIAGMDLRTSELEPAGWGQMCRDGPSTIAGMPSHSRDTVEPIVPHRGRRVSIIARVRLACLPDDTGALWPREANARRGGATSGNRQTQPASLDLLRNECSIGCMADLFSWTTAVSSAIGALVGTV